MFAKGTRVSGIPSTLVSYEQAAEWVLMGVARWVNRKCKSIIMLVEKSLPGLRGMSCKMGPRVSEAAVMGSKFHISIVDAWESANLPIAA